MFENRVLAAVVVYVCLGDVVGVDVGIAVVGIGVGSKVGAGEGGKHEGVKGACQYMTTSPLGQQKSPFVPSPFGSS